MSFQIWANAADELPDPECDTKELVDTYITREGALAKARTLLREGRSVEIVPLSEAGR